MNKRTVEIINYLDQHNQELSLNHLAEYYKVSQRTIRNDINEINDVLKKNNLKNIELKKGGLIIKSEDFSQILGCIERYDYYSYKLSKEERKKVIAEILINTAGYITLSTIADALYVSRATIINDLEETKEFINKMGLEVISHPNKGLKVEGKESDKRKGLLRICVQETNSKSEKIKSAALISVQAGDIYIIKKIIHEQEHIHQNFLTDDSFNVILQYLRIMINRNLQGEYIECQLQEDNSKYPVAQDIMKYITQYCQIRTTIDEVRFLSVLLKQSYYLAHRSADYNSIKIQMITRRFICEISDELGINLNRDYDFFENLSNHLESMFRSEKTNFPKNETLNEIVEEHPEVVKAVTKKSEILEKNMNRVISNEEKIYIEIHICAALERKKNREVSFHVIVACHAGIGTSQLLMERLKKHFNFQIVDIISSHEASYIEEDKADFIISTVPLKNCKLDHVVVTPLFTDEDYIRVGNKIDTLRNSKRLSNRIEEAEISAKGVIERIEPIISKELSLEQSRVLMKKLKKEIRRYFKQSLEEEEEIFAPSLHHLLSPRHIQLDVECKDWRDSVRKVSQILLDKGYIEERYVDAMIRNIEENGPYVVVSPGFAVPHEGLDKGSIKVGMSLIRLKEPVVYGAEDLDPVEFVCCLSAVDHKAHLKAFFHLINILGEDRFRQALREAKTPEEMASVIEKFEYEE